MKKKEMNPTNETGQGHGRLNRALTSEHGRPLSPSQLEMIPWMVHLLWGRSAVAPSGGPPAGSCSGAPSRHAPQASGPPAAPRATPLVGGVAPLGPTDPSTALELVEASVGVVVVVALETVGSVVGVGGVTLECAASSASTSSVVRTRIPSPVTKAILHLCWGLTACVVAPCVVAPRAAIGWASPPRAAPEAAPASVTVVEPVSLVSLREVPPCPLGGSSIVVVR